MCRLVELLRRYVAVLDEERAAIGKAATPLEPLRSKSMRADPGTTPL
jgi:hypothetical protein